MCGKAKPAAPSTESTTKVPQSTWNWIDILLKTGKDISFSGSDAVQSASGANSTVKRAVHAQGPYIPASTSTKSICETLEKLLLQLKAGKPIGASSPSKSSPALLAQPPPPGPGMFMPTFSDSYSFG